ncbi:MAG: bifunctional diguanylate cyclase/phosphodiesterase [Parvularcula sp.]|jgi:diguanylate cyclase (GGDEF)-like protein|nr:bifunctional diguanylate cyclase/phosphodiesterase [Parvularcula sp.]
MTSSETKPRETGKIISGERIEQMRSRASRWLLAYFWIGAAALVILAQLVDVPTLDLLAPLSLLGALISILVYKAPASVQTRLSMAVSINALWMFGLYVVKDVDGGAYMLEVHMLYFITSAILISYACWRAILLTAAITILHHALLNFFAPVFVWQDGQHTLMHLANHAFLGTLNCAANILIAQSVKRYLQQIGEQAADAIYQAEHDPLSGLLNRRGLRAEVLRSCSKSARWTCVFQIDLDGFKRVNDTHGHETGDLVLVETASRIASLLPRSAAIARVGGDEFTIFAVDVDDATAEELALEIIARVSEPFAAPGQLIRISASVGYTSTTAVMRESLDKLMHDADLALYTAKRLGKNRVAQYSAHLRASLEESELHVREIECALEESQFEPWFQPQHDTNTGAVTGIEVLARWRHPEKGILAPPSFLHSLKELGREGDLDEMMLTDALNKIRQLEDNNINVPRISFNLSLARVRDPHLVERLNRLPKPKARIAIEIVETIMFEELSAHDLSRIQELRDLGIEIDVDDFGTGHASMIALTGVHPHRIKIDRSLVSGSAENDKKCVLLSSIADIAHTLGIGMIAEGVETIEELEQVAALGVSEVQGYLFSPALSTTNLGVYLQDTSRRKQQVAQAYWFE